MNRKISISRLLKYLAIYLAGVALVNSCSTEQKDTNFELTVHFKQPVSDTLIYRYTGINGNEVAGSAVISNGEAIITGETCHPYWFWFGSRAYNTNGSFYISPGTVTLELDTSNYSHTVNGSESNDENLNQYKPFRKDLDAEARKYIKMYSELRNKVNNDVHGPMEDSLNTLYGKYEYYDRLKKKEYIKTYPDSYVSLAIARNMYSSAVSYEEIREVYDLLGDKMKNEVMGKDLLRKVNIARVTGIGSPAPEFTLPDSTGASHSLGEFKGKYVLLDFWYSGCPPCRAQIPRLKELHREFKSKGFEILGVSHDRLAYRSGWIAALRKDQPDWLNLLDEYNKVCDTYGIEAFPSNFLIGPDGKIILYNIESNELERWLVKNLN